VHFAFGLIALDSRQLRGFEDSGWSDEGIRGLRGSFEAGCTSDWTKGAGRFFEWPVPRIASEAAWRMPVPRHPKEAWAWNAAWKTGSREGPYNPPGSPRRMAPVGPPHKMTQNGTKRGPFPKEGPLSSLLGGPGANAPSSKRTLERAVWTAARELRPRIRRPRRVARAAPYGGGSPAVAPSSGRKGGPWRCPLEHSFGEVRWRVALDSRI